ncbi:MAG: helix-turn-helix domain-containing protein [Limnochordia bacterium]|nr:helix-turn-helix domain-containing protein [Limnochordia bacterium]MDD4517670.1 helix-turn-helix domain-containing protein [Limnochordia bacterium]
MRYHQGLKMQRAATLLELSSTMEEIVQVLGYSSLQAFSRTFRKQMGLSHRDYLRAVNG